MNNYPYDIKVWISNHFSDTDRVYMILESLTVEETNRVVRCILTLSDNDYDSIISWVKKANTDRRDIIFYAEYDNRNVRRFNYNYPIDKQIEYNYKE